MMSWIIPIIFVTGTILFWLGYLARKREDDFLPLCFIYNADDPNQSVPCRVYVGFWGFPTLNGLIRGDALFEVELRRKNKSSHACFMISPLQLIHDDGNGTVGLVLTAGYLSKAKDQKYLNKVSKNGFVIHLLTQKE